MMADIKSTFMHLPNNLAKSSGDFVKNTKLNMELANNEENLKSLYIEVGKKVHEIYSFGGSLGQPFDDYYKDIIMCEAKIKDLRERIDIVKGVRTCEKCGKGVDRKSEFCPHCGNNMFNLGEISGIAEAPTVGAPMVESPATGYPAADSSGEPFNMTDAPTAEGSHTSAPVVETKICNACGTENDKNARFCLGCGRVI